MGNTIFIKDSRVFIKPLRSRLESIQKLHRPTTAKRCRSFAGMVNFLSMFCPELQKIFKPIYHLTRKGMKIHMGKRVANDIQRNKMQINKTTSFTFAQ